MGKNPLFNVGDIGLIPGSGGSPKKEMVTHSGILAWEIHGQRSLEGYIVQGVTAGSDMT